MSVRARLLATVLSVLALVGGGMVLAPLPASAAVTTLCKGYSACAKAGMSASGYAKVRSTMYWRMYAGHNCTNYAAYRMVKSGLPNVRPWSGSGNATNWGVAMSSITNQTPRVGSVAWWKAGVWPAGSAGHVGYVERVVSADEIIVSQDSWGGDFSWTRVTRTGKGWPSGFIHFNDVPMLSVQPPLISGTAKVGATLTVSPGVWRPSDATTTYQWRADGIRIAGATSPALTLTEAMLGKRLTVNVTASKLGYPTTRVVSAATDEVLPGVISNTVPPVISGEPRVDATLAATPGSWNPAPDTLTYQWLADGKPVAGATGLSLPVDPSLIDKSLALRVVARRSGYTNVRVTSTRTRPVVPGTLSLTAPPTVAGTPQPGETLTLALPRVTPSATPSVQWLRGGLPVEGATGTSYRLTTADLGARVTARVGLTRLGYTTLVAPADPTPRVRSTPRIRLALEPRRGRVRVVATVAARGVSPVTGTVRIRTRGHDVVEVPLRDGVARATLTGLRAGPRTVRVVLPVSRTVGRGVQERRVTVF